MSSDTSAASSRPPRPMRLLRGAARLLAAAGLAADAYLHAHLADRYDEVSANISQGDLFRIEAGLAALAALLVLVWRRVPSDAFAWLVATGGLALLLIYRYVDVGRLGPIPDMYEPVWFGEKVLVVVAEAVAVLATAFLLVTFRHRRSRLSRRKHRSGRA